MKWLQALRVVLQALIYFKSTAKLKRLKIEPNLQAILTLSQVIAGLPERVACAPAAEWPTMNGRRREALAASTNAWTTQSLV
eukprot:2230819-Pleurochrysis_carterae.AAC.1